MFDIGFSELLVIALVTLIVVGPERLPKVARTLGHLFGRLQRYVNDVKADISREMELEELRKMQASVQETAREIERSIQEEVSRAEREVQSVADSVEKSATEGLAEAGASRPASLEPEAPGQGAAADQAKR
ncbi:MAG: twin-arginine translocase subunit TatB [Azospira oryzae]|nr:MAG: twin-arginine translocase subunit TatB [Azospira oryzae]PZP82841.1 MAG: twin-arginine translocase subunit TatB [Azospira oryzae]